MPRGPPPRRPRCPSYAGRCATSPPRSGVAQPAERAAALQVDSALPLLGTGVTRQIADDVSGAVDVLFRLHPSP